MPNEQRPEPGPDEVAFIRIAQGSGFKALTAPFCNAVRETEGLADKDAADILGAWAVAGMEDPGDARRAWEAIGPTGQAAMNMAINAIIDSQLAILAAQKAKFEELRRRGAVEAETHHSRSARPE